MRIDPNTLNQLTRLARPAVVQEAIALASRGAVTVADSSRTDNTLDFRAIVRDTRGAHGAELILASDGDISSWCSCDGDETLCSHVAAAMLTVFSATSTSSKQPSWKNELDSVLPEPEPEAQASRYCLFLTVTKPGAHRYGEPVRRSPYLAVRPGERGQRGSWIKGNASWGSLAYTSFGGEAMDALHHFLSIAQLSAEHSYYYRPDWIALGDIDGSLVLPALDRLRRAEVPLVSPGKSQHPVIFDDVPFDVRGTVTKRGSSLRLSAELHRDDAPLSLHDLYWIGDPTVAVASVRDTGLATEQTTIIRSRSVLPPVAMRLLIRKGSMTISASERDEFESDYLPRVQAAIPSLVSPDGSFAVPDPRRAELVLTITYAENQVFLAWEWERPAGYGADKEHEERILTAIRVASGLQAELLFPSDEDSSRVRRPADRVFGRGSTAIFVAEILPKLREVEGLRISESAPTPDYHAADVLPVVSLGGERDGDWFDLHVSVELDGESVDFAELFTALTLDEPVFVLPSGTFFPLDGTEFLRLREIIEEARSLVDRPLNSLRVSRYQVDLWNELAALGVVAAREAEWWLAVQSLTADAAVEPVQAPAGLRAELRDYQAAGFAWLHFLRTHGLGGVLADDMGLGKTIQTIAMIEKAREENPAMAPFLVVAPTSVIGNWAREIEKFAPHLRVVTITAMGKKRGMPLADAVSEAHVVVTSYALLRLEAEAYRDLIWSGLILDEAQQIKNHTGHGYRAARDLGAPFTLVITGTPMENNLLELWALTSLAAPGLLGTRQAFTDFYRTPIEKEQNRDRLTTLQRRLRPFLLRRTKELVASELPPKQEQVLEIDLHPKHRRLYDVRFQRERQKVLGLVDDVAANRFQIFRSLTMLRQLALDPALVDAGSAPSAKLEALVDLLVEAAEEGHRVLVLSQFTRFLSAAHQRAVEAGVSSAYLDGMTTDRQRVIDGFRDGDAPAFFVSLKAGGFGLNLVEADYVVLLDPWWNPAVEEQAIDRAHRIGQTRPVIVYRLVSTDTIEQKVIALRESKAQLFAQVLDAEGPLGSSALSADDIRELLE